MIHAVIFDLDGTLIDSLDDLGIAGNRTLRHYGYPTHPIDAYRHFVGDGVLMLARRMLPQDVAFSEDQILAVKNHMHAYYAAHSLDQTKPYPGVARLIAFLKEKGLRLGVVSNKPDAAARHVVHAIFGAGVFDRVTGQREGIPHKPDPAAVQETLDAFGVRPSQCLYVGDSGVDMCTARRAGCVPVGVLWGYREYEELIENGAKYLMESPGELEKLVGITIDERTPFRIQ